MKTIAYQGIPGSFSHQAACTYFGNNIKLISKDNFGGVFEAVERGEVEWGILPVENSSIGVISKVFDLLYEYDLNIQGELYLEVQHNLLVLPNTRLEDIDEVYSHPQAIEQCSQFLSQHLNWKVIPFFDTAKSAEWVKNRAGLDMLLIASAEAANSMI